MRFNMMWEYRRLLKQTEASAYASFWIILLSVVLVSLIRGFPFNAGPGDLAYAAGRLCGIFGLIFLALVITSRNLFTILKNVTDPVMLDRALRVMEACGFVLVFLHPLLLVSGGYLMQSPGPWDILIPDFSTLPQAFVACGCVAFWMLFVAGVFFVNRNRVTLNHSWKYVHALVYPAFFLSVLHAITAGMGTDVMGAAITMLLCVVSFSTLFGAVELLAGMRKDALRRRRAERTPRNEALQPAK